MASFERGTRPVIARHLQKNCRESAARTCCRREQIRSRGASPLGLPAGLFRRRLTRADSRGERVNLSLAAASDG
jgi:hypothetical protein